MFKSGYIAILGAPNAGKSTLLNAILKEKLAIVTNKPQTTRKKFKGIYSTDQAQIIFLDTPGVHTTQKKLNLYMMKEIKEAVYDADILCYLVAVDEQISEELKEIFQKNISKPSLVLLNKTDLPTSKHKISSQDVEKEFPNLKVFPLSALTQKGVDEFIESVIELLPEGPAYFPEDQLTDTNLRDIAAEMIREKVTDLTFQELPYSVAVVINEFKESPELTRIEATIIVDQDSQKGMIIGKGGSMIKKIGTDARKDIEKLVNTKVFLELRVKVDKKWTKDPAKMARYGYALKKR